MRWGQLAWRVPHWPESIPSVWWYPSAPLQGWWRVEPWVQQLVFALTRARVLARARVSAQLRALARALVQASA